MSTTAFEIETDDTGQPIRSNTTEWLMRRRTGIGASEAPAVLNLSPWSTPLDVWREKVATEITDEQTEAMEFGHLMEPIAVELFRRRHGDSENTRHRYLGDIEPSPGLIRSTTHRHLLASLDSVIVTPTGQRVPGQIKNVTQYKRTAWADSEGGVPDLVKVQVMQEAMLLDADHGYVLPIFGGNHMPEPIRVDVPDDFAEWWVNYSAEWWEQHIVARVAPQPTLGDDLASLYTANAGQAVDLDLETVRAIERLSLTKAEIKLLEHTADELALQIKAFMGDATEAWDRITDPNAPRLVATWRQNREGKPSHKVDDVTLLRDHPELADLLESYTIEIPARRAARPLLLKK